MAEGDEISGTIGDDPDGVAVGKNIRQEKNETHNNPRQQARSDPSQNQRADPRMNLRAGDTYFGGGESQWVTGQILDHGQQIRELIYRLDNIPNEFRELKDKVKKLEDTEIVVRPAEVVLRPIPPAAHSESLTLSARAMFWILIVAVIVFAVVILLLVKYR